MIFFLKSWCEGIIVAIVISLIIESILPEEKNKKYIKVVSGIYILFVILNPVIPKIDKEIKFDKYFKFDSVQSVASIDDNIKSVYIKGIEESLKEEIEKKGFIVIKIKISVDTSYEYINQIDIVISKNKIGNIEPVIIGNQENEKKYDSFLELKNYISENYNIDANKIIIKLYE